MKAYSIDLRKKIVESVRRGVSKSETARRFGVNRSTVVRYLKRLDETACLAPNKALGSRPKLDGSAMRLLEEDLKARPWATHKQRSEFLLAARGVEVSEATICRAIKKHLSHTRKKRSTGAIERDEWLRVVWRSVVGGLDSRNLVFVDEMGTHTSLAPLYGYSPRGQRAFFTIPRNRGTNTTLLSCMSLDGMGPSMAIEGSTTKEVFERYVEHLLAPTLRARQVVVMDNLSAHKGESVRKVIEDRGCKLLYLPPYSPDLNPIEEAFSKIKRLLRVCGVRTKEALVEAIGKALDVVGAGDARGFFTHCGYGGLEQRS
jgi:transposase